MTTALSAASLPHAPAAAAPASIRIALLGLGCVGSAFATLARQPIDGCAFALASALVRSPRRPRRIDTSAIALTADADAALAAGADVVVELLGGIEPARSLVLAALASGTPVVTANKTLLAYHGDELLDAAARFGTPLLYEASVLAGVPFLGTYGHRPHARGVTSLCGIVNGTSNFIVSRMADGAPFAAVLADAQRAGYAEPDPSKDVAGEDAVEKLCVLLRHFAGVSVAPPAIERRGIEELQAWDVECAAAFGGAIKPIVWAEWEGDRIAAFVGPAFLPASHPLSRVDGVQNGLALRSRIAGDLFMSGPGAGPDVTAATVLDDVVEACRGGRGSASARAERRVPAVSTPDTSWFVRITAEDLGDAQRAASVLATLGVRLRRSSPVVQRDGLQHQWVLTCACANAHISAALDVLAARVGGSSHAYRATD